MTRSTAVLRFALAAAAAGVAPIATNELAAQEPVVSAESRSQESELYTVEELDNLLAPVALYPDPILAQLFIAATYPDQIALAARYLETYGAENLDEQSWDISVRAIAHYGPVLNMLAERPNWATAVGRAYALQPGDVMASVQNLRRLARAQGNLQTTDQQRVEVEREYIRIIPAQPRVVYVPVYDPYVVYYRPVNFVQIGTPYWSFGVGYPIGAWLNYDLDWDTRVVYYHGWNGYGRRHTWYHASRPYIAFNSIYIGSRYTHISINFGVRNRYVNYDGFGYYNTVHRNNGWNRRGLPGRRYAYGNGNGNGNGNGYSGYGDRDRSPRPDRYGVPSNGGSTYRPDKGGNGAVPRAGGTGSVGNSGSANGAGNGAGNAGRPGRDDSNGRPSRGGSTGPGRTNGDAGRGNGNGGSDAIADRSNSGRVTPRTNGSRMPVDEDRVKPVRIGGTSRPLYPRGETASSDRVRSGSATGNAPDRGQTRATSEGFGAPSNRGRDADPVRTPRATSSERITPSSPSRSERSAPQYDAPRAERSAPRYDAPRSQPRAERSAPRSSPRVSAPRSSEPRASAPRASAPRSTESRSSAPRASSPRGGSSGSTPRASRGGGRDRG